MKQSKKTKTNGWHIASAVFFGLLVLAQLWAVWSLWKLNMLPGSYFAVICVLLVVITAILGIMMFPKIGRHQKSKCIGRRVTAYVLSVLIIIGSAFGGQVLGKVNQTVDAITNVESVSAYLSVYVLKEDPAQDLNSAKNYRIGITEAFGGENLAVALGDLEKQWGSPAKTQMYDSVFAMIDALYAGKVRAVILDESYLSILSEVEGYGDFEERTRSLHQAEVVVEKPTEPPKKTDKPAKKDSADDPFIVYLSGSDTRSTKLTQSRSDVNILAVVNPKTHELLLINTPRDYYIPNPASGNGALDKLTHCGLFGQECSAEALGNLYDQDVEYYAQINFTGFETLIDSVGGINVVSDVDDGVYLRKGDNYMDGSLALEFARERYSYSDGDNARGRHQMQVIQALVQKLLSGSIITHYADILDSLQGMFVTNMPSEKISQLVQTQIKDMSGWNINSFAVTGTGGSDIPWSMPGMYAYVTYPSQASVDQASELISMVLEGKSPTAEDLTPVA